jgi:hypothetical protein
MGFSDLSARSFAFTLSIMHVISRKEVVLCQRGAPGDQSEVDYRILSPRGLF